MLRPLPDTPYDSVAYSCSVACHLGELEPILPVAELVSAITTLLKSPVVEPDVILRLTIALGTLVLKNEAEFKQPAKTLLPLLSNKVPSDPACLRELKSLLQ